MLTSLFYFILSANMSILDSLEITRGCTKKSKTPAPLLSMGENLDNRCVGFTILNAWLHGLMKYWVVDHKDCLWDMISNICQILNSVR